ncbi:transmembrane protein, partial [Cyclospora cayetanensis]
MRWLLSRHAYVLRAEDFAVVVALMDLIIYVLVCTTAMDQMQAEPRLSMAALVSSSILFVVALACFVVIRMFRTSKYSVDSYMMPVMLIVNLACTMYLQLTNEAVGLLSGVLMSYYFILTGYPFAWLVAFAVMGLGVGVVLRLAICSLSLALRCNNEDWVDVGLFAVQLLMGTAFYFSIYELGVLILRYKKYPAKHLDQFPDLSILDGL